MKKFFLAILIVFPLTIYAQTTTPLTPQEQLERAQKQLEEAQKAVEKAKAEAKKAEEVKAERQKAGTQKLTSETESINKDSSDIQTHSGWVAPATTKKSQNIRTRNADISSAIENDARYLAGAVPEENGKVVFTLDVNVPGKSSQQIFEITYNFLNQAAQGPEQFDESAIVLENKDEHIIAARYKEWLTFSNNFISLDRTEFNYMLIAKCSDQHLHLTMERLNYNYEEGRNTGFKTSAEDWIVDKFGLNKKKSKLSKISGKFRKKTIDRKDELFHAIENALTI